MLISQTSSILMFFYKTEKLLIVNLIHDLNFTISDYTCNKQTFNVYIYYIIYVHI